MNDAGTGPVLYGIVCGAGPAIQADRLVTAAHARGWDLYVIATPTAAGFVDVTALEAQTGHPVRVAYGPAREGRAATLPHASAIVVAPATFNTINKWAAGASDNYALGVLAESFGLRIPTVVVPFVNHALAAHFAFQRSVASLRAAGARILLGPGTWEPHPPGDGRNRLAAFPWTTAIDEARRALDGGDPCP